MSEYDITAKVTYDTTGAVASLNQVTGATKAASVETLDLANKSRIVTKTMGDAAPKIGQFGSTVGLAGQAVGKLNPALGQTVTIAGSALGSIQALTTLGMGPLGIAIGVASVAMASITALLSTMTDRQNEARIAAEDHAQALRDLSRTDAESRNERLTNLRAGELAMRRELETSIRTAGELGNVRASQLRTNIEYLQREIGRAESDIASRSDEGRYPDRPTGTTPPRTSSGGGRARGAAGDTGPDATALAAGQVDEKQRAFAVEMREQQQRADDEARTAREAAAREEVAFQQSLYDQQISDAEDFQAKQRAIDDAAMERKRADAQELADIQNGVADGFAVLNDVIMASAGSSEKAQKQAQAVMAGVAVVEAGIQAALEVARSAAAYPDVVGMAAHATAAAAFVVAGVKAATMGGGSAPSGGGGAPSARTGGPAMSGGGSERGGDTIIVNLGSTALYAADRAQLGRDIDEMVGASRSRLGRTG